MHVNCSENPDADEEGPGPSTYHLKPTIGMPKKTDPSLWQSPAYSLRGLIITPDCVSSPGPAYLPCYPNLKRAPTPKILFPLQNMKENIIITRANVNTLRKVDKPVAPIIFSRKKGYTLKWRTKYSVGETGVQSPGPAAYGLVNTDVYKYRAPARTFGMRTWDSEAGRPVVKLLQTDKNVFTTTTTNAVPCQKSCLRKFTFGVKHSRKRSPYVMPADNNL